MPRTRLKSGQLQALVATASLELGIDIGHVDLVCQIGSPHRIATLLQRVGRSGHSVAGPAQGPAVSRSRCDDLVECTALLRAVRRGGARRDRRSTMRRSTCWRSRSSPRPRRVTTSVTAEDALFELVRARVAVPRADARPSSTRSSRWPPRASRPGAAGGPRCSTVTKCNGTRARPARRTAAGADLGRRHPGDRRLPRRPRSRRDVRRHPERGLRDRELRRRRVPARQHVVADPAGCRRDRAGR